MDVLSYQDVCSPPLKPFFTRMNEVLLVNQKQMMQKCLHKIKIAPTAQLRQLRVVAAGRVCGARLMARQLHPV